MVGGMTSEEKARFNIDELLTAAGWQLQDYKKLNLGVCLGVAVREYPTESGPTDYLLFVDRKPVGVIEAKPTGTTLSGVAEQSERYLTSRLKHIPCLGDSLRFGYESTGVETYFRDLKDPDPRSRRLFAFHKPETLQEWLFQTDTLRIRVCARFHRWLPTGCETVRLYNVQHMTSNTVRSCQQSVHHDYSTFVLHAQR
jgi:type I restriction enzyme R subunit